jgi:hypothetical protein
MMRLRTAEELVAPLESDDGRGTRSSTASARPDRPATLAKVLCSRTAKGGTGRVGHQQDRRGDGLERAVDRTVKHGGPRRGQGPVSVDLESAGRRPGEFTTGGVSYRRRPDNPDRKTVRLWRVVRRNVRRDQREHGHQDAERYDQQFAIVRGERSSRGLSVTHRPEH